MALGRREEDDRDHYGNKRLDLGGPLLANLFRQLFRCGLWVWVARCGGGWVGWERGEGEGSPLRREALRCSMHAGPGPHAAAAPSPVSSPPYHIIPPSLPHAIPPRRKLSKDVRGYVQKCVDKGKEINLTSAINKDTITRGLRCGLVLLAGWMGGLRC